MLYVLYHNLRACGAIHVVNLLKLNHTESFILLFFFAEIRKSWATIPYYILSVQHPEQCPALVRGM